jgi:hypothetical protein
MPLLPATSSRTPNRSTTRIALIERELGRALRHA